MIPSQSLLRDADLHARDILLDAHEPDRAEPLLRGWVEVIECAAGVWAAIPTGPGSHQWETGHPLNQVQAIARDINRNHRVPDEVTVDERTRAIADLLADVSEQVPADFASGRTPTPSMTADATALRAGLLHTCYVLTHATAVSLRSASSQVDGDPSVGERAQELATLRVRIGAAEQILDTHIHKRPTATIKGCSPDAILADAISRWDVVVHDTVRTHPDPKNLAIIADVNLGLLANTARLAVAWAANGLLDATQVTQRLLPALETATRAWDATRRDWTALASPRFGPSRELLRASHEVRRALGDPDLSMASGTPNALTLGLAAGQEAAVLSARALANPELQASADAVVRLTAALADRHPEQVSFATWHSLERLGGRAPIPLPDVVRADLAVKASRTVDAAGAARSASQLLMKRSSYATSVAFHTGTHLVVPVAATTATLRPKPTATDPLARRCGRTI